MAWNDLAYQEKVDLDAWYNVSKPNAADYAILAELFESGKFWAWNCPTCGTRCYWGSPEDWGDFQGVNQNDYYSYPGSPELYSRRLISQQCDTCRMNVPCDEDMQLVGDGEPLCWEDEE